MNYSNVFGRTQRQFDITMNRECITVTDYFDASKQYDVFFRRNNRGTTPQGKLRFFYAQSTPITIGTIFVLKDESYIVTSQDGIESDIYFTSLAVKCDTSFNIYSQTEKKYIEVPFSVISDKYTVSHGSVFSMVSGSVAMFTQDCPVAKEITVDTEYYAFGGYYKVGNTFYNNGLAYVYMERIAQPQTDKYVLTYDGETSIDMSVSTTYQLTYTAMKNDVMVENPTLTYSSSDNTIATVDTNGLITAHAAGTAKITATWTDGDNMTTCNTDFNITGSSAAYTTEIYTSSTTIKVGGSYKSLTLKFYDADGTDITTDTIASMSREEFVWTCSCDGADLTDSELVTWLNGTTVNSMRIKLADDRTYLTKTLVVTCVVDGVTASLDLEIGI